MEFVWLSPTLPYFIVYQAETEASFNSLKQKSCVKTFLDFINIANLSTIVVESRYISVKEYFNHGKYLYMLCNRDGILIKIRFIWRRGRGDPVVVVPAKLAHEISEMRRGIYRYLSGGELDANHPALLDTLVCCSYG